jgi:hypothetical protein
MFRTLMEIFVQIWHYQMKQLYAMPIIMFFLCIGVVFLRIKKSIVYLVRDVYLDD